MKANVSAGNVKGASARPEPKAGLAVMEECGIKVTRNPAEMGKLMKSVMR